MNGSIDSTGCTWQREVVELDPDTAKLLVGALPEIERELMDALAMEPNAAVVAGVVADDGKIGIAHAATMKGYRNAPEPIGPMPERVLWEAVGAALRRPTTPGWEHVVLAEHRLEGTVGTVRILSIETDVRSKVREVLGESHTADERLTVQACDLLPQPPDAGPGLEDCGAQVDAQLEGFGKVLADLAEDARAMGVRPTAGGKEMLRWWQDPSRRAKSTMRQRALLVMLLRAGRVDDARWLAHFAEVTRELLVPSPTTARNAEVVAMSASILFAAADTGPVRDARASLGWEERAMLTWEHIGIASHLCERMYSAFRDSGMLDKADVRMAQFLEEWRRSAFARLEVSHKLSAALCLTDVPEGIELQAPWTAWSLLVPDGLLGPSQPARIWCLGIEPSHIVTSVGKIKPWSEENVGGPVAAEMLRALVRSACVVLSDPERRKAEGMWGGGTKPPSRSRRPAGAPQEGARYLLAQPVTIDLRETVREALTGRRGGGGIPKHQFLVRGHPRQQAWGPQHTLRRYKWIEPYWKGDPDARILLRGHRMQEGEEPEKKPASE